MEEYISGERISKLCDVCIYDRNELRIRPFVKDYCNKIIYAYESITKETVDVVNSCKIFFCKSDCIGFFCKNILPLINSKFVFVTHNSSLTVGNNKDILNSKFLIRWYGQNMIPHVKSEGIPLGIANSGWKHGNLSIIEKNHMNNKTDLLYVNFSIGTNTKKRTEVLQKLEKNGFNMTESCDFNDYIEQLSLHKFCISPPGNGVDCHRIWESLYVGCIPIVEKDPLLYPYFKDMRILFIDDFNIITEEYLNEVYNKMTQCYNNDKLKLSYWKRRFNEK